MRVLTPFSILLLLLSGPAWSLPGDPDPTFVYPTPAVLEPDSTDVVPMPTGWMVVKSRLPTTPVTTSTVELTRIDNDGRPMASFGNAGRVVTQLPAPFNVSLAAASTSDGGFVVAGYKRLNNNMGDTVAAVVRLTAQGQVDTTFGDSGIIEIDTPFARDRVGAIQQLDDGRIALLAWSLVDDNSPYDCANDRTAIWYLSADGRQRQEVHAIVASSYTSGSCRSVLTLQAGWDDQDRYRILYGNKGIFEGNTAIMPWDSGYGTFAFYSAYPVFYTYISQSGIELRGGPTPSANPRSYAPLGSVAGFIGEPIAWNGMALDLADRAAYLGVSTDGGRAAIVRFTWTGALDTSWGDGDGVAVIEGAGSDSDMALEGIANDIRLLQVMSNGLIVATADGVIRRLQTGSAQSNGAFVLRPPLIPVDRTNSSLSVIVERAGSNSGVATVQYAIKEVDCNRRQCPSNWGEARDGQDFVATSGTLRWEDGDSSDKTIRVELLKTTSTQPYEVLVAELSNASAGAKVITDWEHIFLGQSLVLPPPPAPIPPKSGNGGGSSSGGGAASGPLLLLLSLLSAAAASRNRSRLRSAR